MQIFRSDYKCWPHTSLCQRVLEMLWIIHSVSMSVFCPRVFTLSGLLQSPIGPQDDYIHSLTLDLMEQGKMLPPP